jgi:DNA uptake protein ComE-like DNA-binding protein
MNFNFRPLNDWFGFSRRERRASFVLLIIIVILIALRYIIPAGTGNIGEISGNVLTETDFAGDPSSPSPSRVVYKPYNIKKSGDTLQKQGAPGKSKVFIKGATQGYENSGKRAIWSQKTLTDINTCDSADLVKLPGIGPVLSARIIKYRNYLGGYASISQLQEVYGLSPETYELIKSRVKADTAVIKRIGINTASYKELSRIRYLEKYEISAILKYRDLKGRIDDIQELIDNKLVAGEKAGKIEPYLRFD